MRKAGDASVLCFHLQHNTLWSRNLIKFARNLLLKKPYRKGLHALFRNVSHVVIARNANGRLMLYKLLTKSKIKWGHKQTRKNTTITSSTLKPLAFCLPPIFRRLILGVMPFVAEVISSAIAADGALALSRCVLTREGWRQFVVDWTFISRLGGILAWCTWRNCFLAVSRIEMCVKPITEKGIKKQVTKRKTVKPSSSTGDASLGRQMLSSLKYPYPFPQPAAGKTAHTTAWHHAKPTINMLVRRVTMVQYFKGWSIAR